jgi:lysophospholipase L1-like esterase
MHGLVYWPLLALLAPQALWLRRTAPRFAPAAGEPTGQVLPAEHAGAAVNLLALGDSIIAGVGARQLQQALVGQVAHHLAEQLRQPVHWCACGKAGAAADFIQHRLLARAPATPADVVLVSTGVNDVLSGCSSRQWRVRIAQLHAAIHNHSPHALVVFCGVPPMGQFPRVPQPLRAMFGARAARFDRVLQDCTQSLSGALHVGISGRMAPEWFAEDGFHPSELGYARFGAKLAGAMSGSLKNARAHAVV